MSSRKNDAPGGDAKAQTIWCAVYTRKSTDENLNSGFTSLDAQRDYCESFIRSRAGERWKVYPETYVDAGYTGGNIDRPGMKKLIADAKAGKFQVVVTYKYDRLSRNTRDFLQVLDIFDKNRVAFVSVTQPIDTASSIGRLMRSILVDFSQFEREIISERTRDKMAAMVKKGRRAGGKPILGYDIDWESKLLVVNKDEARAVLDIFETYARLKSLSQVAKYAHEKGYRIKSWTTRDGKKSCGGGRFLKNTLQYHLRNPLYSGKIRHLGTVHPGGVHEAIVPEELFDQVGRLLQRNESGRAKRTPRRTTPFNFMLRGLVRCAHCKAAMSPHYNGKGVRAYRCQRIMKLDKTACTSKSANATALEKIVTDRLAQLAKNQGLIEKIVAAAATESGDELPAKRQTRIELETQRRRVDSEIRNLIAVLAQEGPASARYRSIMDSLSEREALRSLLDEKLHAADREIVGLESQRIDADTIRNNLGQFETLFAELGPDERAEMMRLFVREIKYDGLGEKLEILLRPLPSLDLQLDGEGHVSNNVQIGCGTRTRT